MSDERREVYIGDGVYASWRGFAIKLRAPREFGDHEIWLEAREFDSLLNFIAEHTPWRLNKTEA